MLFQCQAGTNSHSVSMLFIYLILYRSTFFLDIQRSQQCCEIFNEMVIKMKENPLPTLFHTVSNKGNKPWAGASNVPNDTGNVLISLLLGILVNAGSQPQQLDKTAICTHICENILYEYDIQYKSCQTNTFHIDVRIVRHKFAYYGSPF